MTLKLWVLASAVLLLAGCQSTSTPISDQQSSKNALISVRQAALA
jgi:uncharacterized lipoprotein YajG